MKRLLRPKTAGFLAAGVLAFAILPFFHDSGDPAAGKTVYSTYCASCHGEDGKPAMAGVPDFSSKAFQDSKTDDQLVQSTKGGNGGMPGFAAMIDDKQVVDVVAHIRTLAK